MFNLIPISQIQNNLEAKRIFRKLNLEKVNSPLDLPTLHYVEELLRLMPNQIELKHNNIFGDEVYLRELSVSKNNIVIGHTHKNPHLFILLRGKAKIITPYENFIMNQGDIINSKAYSKKIAITYEDSSFLNVYKNPKNLKSEEEIVNELTVNREESRKCLLV
jgi:hypothetical protein